MSPTLTVNIIKNSSCNCDFFSYSNMNLACQLLFHQ